MNLHHAGDVVRIEHIEKFKRSAVTEFDIGRHANIAGDDIFFAIPFAEGSGQFRADLADRSGNKDFFHGLFRLWHKRL